MNKLTRGTKKLIDITIQKHQMDLNSNHINVNGLVDQICIEVEEKYPGKTLDYNLHRMGLENTTDVKEAVDTYLVQYHKKRERIKKKEG